MLACILSCEMAGKSVQNQNQDHGSTSRETARALEPLNSTSEDKEFTQVKKVTQKSINKISILTCV
jgi:hypothetical protein